MKKNERIVAIVGGSGFIGSALTKELLKRKEYKIVILDKKKPNVMDVEFREVDISNQSELNQALRGVDEVIHLAAMVGVDACLSNSDEVIRINLDGTRKVIEACKLNNIKNLVFSSSSEVYGDGNGKAFKETDRLMPKSVYGKSKTLSEELLKSYSDENFRVKIVRFFNIYGHDQSDNFVVTRFINSILENNPVNIYGDGEQVRCFTNIEDCVKGTIKALEYQETSFEIFNIANNKATTINELVDLIYSELKIKESKRNYINFGEEGIRSREVEIFKRVPDISKSKKVLGYEAEVSLTEGIRKIIQHKKEVAQNV